jgi:KaiC/GvpD/RAD55 family RecA-like ATPase
MLSLAQSARRIGELGTPLPDVYDVFNKYRIALRRGATSLIVAAPGVGKTTLAIDWVRRLKVPTLYICIDTAEQDAAARAVAQLTGHPVAEVEQDLSYFAEELAEGFPLVRWYFGLSPTVDEVQNEIQAFGEAFGCYPDLIVIDNLTSIELEAEFSFASVRDAMRRLNDQARSTGAHVMVLHHATGEYEDGTKPIPLSGVEFKAGKLPDMCLTLTRELDEMRVAPVKNRGGIADATGKKHVKLYAELGRMKISEDFPHEYSGEL